MNNAAQHQIDTDMEANDAAILKAYLVVREAKNKGEEMRLWAMNAHKKYSTYLTRQAEEHVLNNHGWRAMNLAKTLEDITTYEDEISHHLRSYFLGLTELLSQLETLSPPLDSQDLERSVEDILFDRRKTIESLDQFASITEEFRRIKNICSTIARSLPR